MGLIINIEFVLSPDGRDIICCQNGDYFPFNEDCHELIEHLWQVIQEDYPQAFENLKTIYKHPSLKYLVVKRFVKCNFSLTDNTLDIQGDGTMKLERVMCPLRGECRHEGIICLPTYNHNLSKRQQEILTLIQEGYTDQQIADMLYISYWTASNHRRAILRKVGAERKTDLIYKTIGHETKI